MGDTHVVVRRTDAIGLWQAVNPPPEGLARGRGFEDSRILEVKAGLPRE